MTAPTSASTFGEVDARPRRLLEEYVALVNGQLTEKQPNLVEITLPVSEKKYFGKLRLVVAYTPDVLDDDAQAEILVNGSELLRKIVAAIQSRGAMNAMGNVIAAFSATNERSTLPVPLEGPS